MSKERAQRRQRRLEEQAVARAVEERRKARKRSFSTMVSRATTPLRATKAGISTAWRPLAGGQTGLLARRRRRRFVVMTVVAVCINIAVLLLWMDVAMSAACAGLTLVTIPVLARLLFSRR